MSRIDLPYDPDSPDTPARLAVWIAAANCRLIEEDHRHTVYSASLYPDPEGAAGTLTARQAWRDTYARGLILDLDADPDRLHRAKTYSRREGAARRRPAWWWHATGHRWRKASRRADRWETVRLALSPTEHAEECEFWSCALDISTRAAAIVHDAGADTNPTDRARLLAGIRHHLTMTTLGSVLPDVAADSTRQLLTELADLDQHDPPPTPPTCGKDGDTRP